MTYITSQSPIRYTIDSLTHKLTGVLASSSSSSIDLTGATNITSINITGVQPKGSTRHIAFRVDNRWGKLTTAGTFSAFSSNTATFENISVHGNTPDDLAALSEAHGLAGKRIGIAIALSTTNPDNSLPTCGISFTCVTDTQILTNTQYSPVYELGANSQVISLTADTLASNGGSVTVYGQATLPDGTLSDWKPIDTLAGLKCSAIQLRGDYKATNVGVSSAQIQAANLIYSDGSALATGLAEGSIITNTIDWHMPIHSCRLTVNHAPLQDSVIRCYTTFRDQPHTSRAETLGIGSGARKTFQLQHTEGIKYDSFVLYYDSARVFVDYELNTEVGRVTCIAPEGVIVSCDYDYGWDSEAWQEMRLTSRISMDGFDRSEYRLSVPDNGKSMCALKISLCTTSGQVADEIIGYGTGAARSYKLTRRILDGRISLTADGTPLSSKNWKLLDDPQYISVAAPAGRVIRASYDWLSEQPTVYKFAAVFAQ